MKPLKERVKDFLEKEPRARERRFRTRAIVNLLQPGLAEEERKALISLIEDAESANRYIRMLQQEDPTLRGEDWGDKTVLEQNKMLDLGYVPGIASQIAGSKVL